MSLTELQNPDGAVRRCVEPLETASLNFLILALDEKSRPGAGEKHQADKDGKNLRRTS